MNSNLNCDSWSIDDIDNLLFVLSLKTAVPLWNCMRVMCELRRAQVLCVMNGVPGALASELLLRKATDRTKLAGVCSDTQKQ